MDPIVVQAVKQLGEGALICFPTETVYALAADATNDKAVEAIYHLKGRKAEVPLSLMVASYEQAKRYGQFNPMAIALAEKCWPGPLTLIVPKHSGFSIISSHVACGLGTVGIRVPDHAVAQSILRAFDRPMVATSVNPSGLPPAQTADAIREYYGDQLYIVEAGEEKVQGTVSTVLDTTNGIPHVVRQGTLSEASLRKIWELRL